MGWQDRGYSEGREDMKAYFANPLGLTQYALTIWRSAGLHVSLTFWFLLIGLFVVMGDVRLGMLELIPVDLGVLLGVSLLHEWGHRIFAQRVGGNHWEWVLWGYGGMVAPTSPRSPWAVFVANIGGIVFNLGLIAVFTGVCLGFGGILPLQRLFGVPIGYGVLTPNVPFLVNHIMNFAVSWSFSIILINLFPCYWFDGGHLWQATLWPKFGQWKAGLITVWAGMILATPLFVFSLWNTDILGMLIWALIFADCFRRRMMLKAVGEYGMESEEESAYNYMDTPDAGAKKKKRKKSWLTRARKRALADQAEQAKIDAILAKVKEQGLHSLSWLEKRTLKKATARQREQDVASRM